jgi:hypothetical protein
LQANPSCGIPADLAEKEAGALHATRSDAIKRELCEPARQPPLNEPLFTELVSEQQGGILTLDLKDGRCLLIFSTPLRAADYVQTLLLGDPPVQYLHSSPLELTQLLHDLRGAGVEGFALDSCPRCDVRVVFSSDSAKTADVLLTIMAIVKSTEIARANLYLEHANGLALAGQFAEARNVALETVGHVTMEDARLHLLLGKIGVALNDRKLVGEAKAFLRFFKSVAAARELDSVIRTGRPTFENPELLDSPNGY